MRRIAEAWLGRPYIADSLIGGPDRAEKLVVNLQAFDCVTFVECILAKARSRSRKGFIEELKQIRYRGGRVEWSARLHYFSDWMKSNQQRKVIKIRTRGPGSRSVETRLDIIAGLPARSVRFHVVPKQKIHLARRRILDGFEARLLSHRSDIQRGRADALPCIPEGKKGDRRTARKISEAEPHERYRFCQCRGFLPKKYLKI
jgi:hypothetical protein